MLLKLQLSNGKTYLLSDDRLSRRSTILSVKEMIETNFDYSIDTQRLLFGGKQLLDEETLYSYAIQPNQTLQLALKIPLAAPSVAAEGAEETAAATSPSDEMTKTMPYKKRFRAVSIDDSRFKIQHNVIARCQEQWYWSNAIVLDVHLIKNGMKHHFEYTVEYFEYVHNWLLLFAASVG